MERIVKKIARFIKKVIGDALKPRETVEDYYRIEYGIKPTRKSLEDFKFPHV